MNIELDKLSIYKDYLNLSSNQNFEEILQKFGDQDSDGYCFTDHIYLLNKKMKRLRIKIAITENYFYLLKGNKNLKLKKKFELRDLEKVSISAKNHTLALFNFRNSGNNLLIDSYRRVDIILYILVRMKKAKYQKFFKIIFLKNFKFSSSANNVKDVKLDQKLDLKKNKLLYLQETFKNSKKSGYLKIRKRKFLKMKFVEFFFMISNIGLIYFKTFGVIFLKINLFFRLEDLQGFCHFMVQTFANCLKNLLIRNIFFL